MERQDIKNILISMRTHENEAQVNFLLGQIDMMSQEKISKYINKLGNSEKNIKNFLEEKLQTQNTQTNDKHTPINEMFTYGASNSCIHLHLPGDLHEMIKEHGITRTIDTVNLHLLDAINRIKNLKNNGFYKFSNIDSIYMISPILLGKQLKFLGSMDFEVNLYKKRELQDDKFVKEHPEAQLATHIFGNDKNIGTASINFDTLNNPKWQEKCKAKIKEFNEKGIVLSQKQNEK